MEGANIVKRHMRPRTLRDTECSQELGGIIEQEGPDPRLQRDADHLDSGDADAPSRSSAEGDLRVRVAKKLGKEID